MINSAAHETRRRVLDLLEARNGFSSAEHEVQRIVAFFRANKYPVLSLRGVTSLGPTWQEEIGRASASFSQQRNEYLRVRQAWLERGIECMAFKSAGIPPSFPYTSDNLDILVRRRDWATAVRVLQELGYVWLTNTDEREKILFRRFRAGRCVLAIHLHTWVGWDAEFHEEDAIWARARPAADDPSVIIPSPEDAILVNVAHAFYENKRFSLFDLEKVRRHWGRNLDWQYIEAVAQRRGWLDGLFFGLAVAAFVERSYYGRSTASAALRRRWIGELRRRPIHWWYYQRLTTEGTVDLPFPVSFAFSKLLYYKKIASDQHESPGRRASNLLHTLAWGVKQKSGLNPQPGILVTFSGIDGAGKSAQADALCRALATCGVTHVRVWSRPGCSPAYRTLAGLIKGIRHPEQKSNARTRRIAPGGKLGRLFWALINVADLAMVYNWNVRRTLLLGNFVICDRYTADAQVELSSRLPGGDRGARWLVSLLRHFAPAPRISYLLDLPAAEAVRRSADCEDEAVLESQRHAYLKLAAKEQMRVLDATREFGQLSDEVVIEALRAYFRSFDTLLNGLLLSNPSQLNKSARRLLAEGPP